MNRKESMLMNRAPTFCSTAVANAVKLVVSAGSQHLQPSPERLRGRLQVSGIGLRIGIGGIYQQADHHRGGYGLGHQFQPLGPQYVHEIGHAVMLPAGRLKLPTSPTLMGSSPITKTTGIVLVSQPSRPKQRATFAWQ
jgi:hypothetical protein